MCHSQQLAIDFFSHRSIMLAIRSILLLLVVSLCSGRPGSDRECAQDVVDFATKVEKSSVVVYGKTMAKIMNNGSDSVFYVFFQVDCILKGPATLRQINILNAGNYAEEQGARATNDRRHV